MNLVVMDFLESWSLGEGGERVGWSTQSTPCTVEDYSRVDRSCILYVLCTRYWNVCVGGVLLHVSLVMADILEGPHKIEKLKRFCKGKNTVNKKIWQLTY